VDMNTIRQCKTYTREFR